MNEGGELEAIKKRSLNNFPELVEFSQKLWRSKDSGIKEISSAVEIQYLAQWGMGFVRNNFPKDISIELRDRVFENHPVPIVAVGVLQDSRVFMPDNSEIMQYPVFPPGMSKIEREFWDRGITIFDEIAADTLTEKVFKTHASKQGKKYKPVRSIGRGYDDAYEELVRLFESTHSTKNFGSFKRELITSSMLIDFRGLDAHAMLLGFPSFNDLAIHIGKKGEYGKDSNRLLDSLIYEGVYGTYPGVITFFGFKKILTLATVFGLPYITPLGGTPIAFQAGVVGSCGLIVGSDIFKLSKEQLVHEISHYLLSGMKNIGLQRVEWKRKNFYNR